MLEAREIGGIPIFRPSEDCEAFVYRHVKARLFERYAPGTYTDIAQVTRIVNAQFESYDELLQAYLPKVDHLKFIAFLIQQYELYGLAHNAFQRGNMSDEDEEIWQSYAMNSRRGIKYLMELVCARGWSGGTNVGTLEEQEQALSILFLSAEELVSLYIRSGFYHTMLDEIKLVLDQSEFLYFHVDQDLSTPAFDVRLDVQEQQKYIPAPDFLHDRQCHNEVMSESFTETFGADYLQVLSGIDYLINELLEASEKPCSVLRERAVEMLALRLSTSLQRASKIIDGFSLTVENMRREKRELFRPKQEYRAYKRAFFVFLGKAGEELVFSQRMAKECLTLLVSDIPFRRVPPEWKSVAIDNALNRLSLQAGRWFERVVRDNLDTIGIRGVASVKRLVFKDGTRLEIPQHVGEIDFIGLCPERKVLVVIEVKQVNASTEPRLYLDDLRNFVTAKGNYVDMFEAKYRWVIEHHQAVANYLAEQLTCQHQVEQVGCAMITRYPLFVARQITRFNCMSITEFMTRYKTQGMQLFKATNIAPANKASM